MPHGLRLLAVGVDEDVALHADGREAPPGVHRRGVEAVSDRVNFCTGPIRKRIFFNTTSTCMKPSVIVWDLGTVPDLGGFAAANDLVGAFKGKADLS